ncbi:hypothetical protein Tco_0166151, partial [Tanacetum coccineum]
LAKRFSDKAPATVDEMMKRLDDFVSYERAFAQTELPKGETGEQHQKSYFLSVSKDDRPFRNNNHVIDQRRYDPQNNYRGRDNVVPYRGREKGPNHLPTLQQRGETLFSDPGNSGNQNSITLGTPEADDTPPEGWKHGQVLELPSRERSPHYDCHHLRRQLEATLEFGKLNHLVKDVRQREIGNQRGDGPQQGQITNMVGIRSLKERKRKA